MITARWKTENDETQDHLIGSLQQDPGHLFEHNIISGGTVHFGDKHYYNITKDTGDSHSLARVLPQSRGPDPLQDDASAGNLNELYIVPRCSIPQFTGRKLQTNMLEKWLHPNRRPAEDGKHGIVVIYGLGGSGKTQFCLRYAERHRKR
jgi:hypothetical protein